MLILPYKYRNYTTTKNNNIQINKYRLHYEFEGVHLQTSNAITNYIRVRGNNESNQKLDLCVVFLLL